ncbi:hypothetical protein IMAU10382_02999 [Lactiplantibacillus plantarum]|nr:hypothetical protein [Lactiplantibacillus plantarum]
MYSIKRSYKSSSKVSIYALLFFLSKEIWLLIPTLDFTKFQKDTFASNSPSTAMESFILFCVTCRAFFSTGISPSFFAINSSILDTSLMSPDCISILWLSGITFLTKTVLPTLVCPVNITIFPPIFRVLLIFLSNCCFALSLYVAPGSVPGVKTSDDLTMSMIFLHMKVIYFNDTLSI